MAAKNENENSACPFLAHFEAIKPFMDQLAIGDITSKQYFEICLKASAAKCFEFNLLVRRTPAGDDGFFMLPALRGICEDLIVLNFVKKMPESDRNELIFLLMLHDADSGVKVQDAFYTAFRPQQPVLRAKDIDKRIAELESKAQAIWNRHGFPKFKKGSIPQIRQIAEKQDKGSLPILYDYFYRLTSNTVHFSVRSLFRSGWGDDQKRFSFSTSNFNAYFMAYCRFYAAFLFCIYFEFFQDFFQPDPDTVKMIDEIRNEVMMFYRWPEMVTFEEMNREPPDYGPALRILVSMCQAEQKKRLIET